MPPITQAELDAANAIVPRIAVDEAQALIAAGALLLDVREAVELLASGKAAGALHIPRGEIESTAHAGAITRDKPVILYCASGVRSALAGKALKDLGYDAVFNLGGLKDWLQAGGALAPR